MQSHTAHRPDRPPPTPRILVVDDEPDRLHLLSMLLGSRFVVDLHQNPHDALASLAGSPADLVISDVRMPEVSGLELLEAVRSRDPDLAVLLITSHATIAQAVEAIKRGAYDYLPANFDDESLLGAVRRGVEHTRLCRRARALETELRARDAFGAILGQSPPMQQLFALLERVRDSDVPVLLTGESGTGKELVARALHGAGKRSSGPFVPVNCGAIPKDLLESELFGHLRGAFSGATRDKPGLIESAEGGTLLLDEVSELPLELQVKLNRFLQDGEVRRLGAVDGRRVDARVVAASNRDLEQEAAAGRFRADVFYRLNVFPIRLPRLRDRAEDIPLLAQTFVLRHAARERRPIVGIEPEALDALCRFGWPGNVRELETVLARAVLLERSERIGLESLPTALAGSKPLSLALDGIEGKTYRAAREQAADRIGREYLRALMSRYRGDVRGAAAHAGVERETLYALLKRHGLSAARFRSVSAAAPAASEEEA